MTTISNAAQPESETESTVIDPVTGQYTRSGSIERTALEKALTALNTRGIETSPERLSAYNAKVFPSGMNAEFSLFHCIAVKYPGCICVRGSELYCDTPKTLNYVCSYTQMQVMTIHISDNKAILDVFKTHGNKIKLFFMESCSNPSGFLFDWSLVSQMKKHSPHCLICVDNTWLTPIIFNPLLHGADLVVDSMTKYISASKRIGGCIITNQPIYNDLDIQGRIMGLNYCSTTCTKVLEELESIEERMKATSTITEQVLAHMRTLPKSKVTRVHHPGPINGLYAGVISFHVESKIKKGLKVILNGALPDPRFKFETSYGACYSKIDSFPRTGCSNDRDFVKQADKVRGVWLRLSIGYESDPNIVIAGIDTLLAAL